MTTTSAKEFLGRPITADYRPTYLGLAGQWYDHRGWFSLYDVERMRRDPQVNFGMRILRAPLHTVTWEVESDRGEVKQWVDRTLKFIWERELVKLTRILEYGYMGGENCWHHDPETDTIEYTGLRDLNPFDIRPLAVHGALAGLSVKGLAGKDSRGVWLRPPRSFWLANESEYGNLYGRPRIAPAWYPWMEKMARHGAVDIRRLWFLKNAYRGGIIRHPIGTIEVANGQYMSNQDYARELVEKMETGGVLALPNISDERGNQLWVFEEPKINGDPRGVREYPQDLDKEILVGMGIQPEVAQAAEVGGGWSGRSVPFLVFLTSEDQIADCIFHGIDEQILRPGVDVNFGEGARYKVHLKSLVPPAEDKQAKQQGKGPGDRPGGGGQLAQPDNGNGGNGNGQTPQRLSHVQGAHAPAGGVTIGGKEFAGGQFIPWYDLAAATPEVKAKVKEGVKARRAEKAKKREQAEQARKAAEVRKAAALARREKVQAAKKAVHEHAKGAENLEGELVNLWWEDPAIEAVHDALDVVQRDSFVVKSPNHPELRIYDREYPKDLSNRRADFVRLEQAAAKALASYSATKPTGEEAEADQGKVLMLLRKARSFAQAGLRKLEAVRQARQTGEAKEPPQRLSHEGEQLSFDESKHPRGQPENAGQFKSGQGGGKGKGKVAEAGFTGEKKDKLGRRICYDEGKRTPCPKPPKPEKPVKPTVDELHAEVAKLKQQGVTHDTLHAFATRLALLNLKEIGELKVKLGVKAAGPKAELARKIAALALTPAPTAEEAAAKIKAVKTAGTVSPEQAKEVAELLAKLRVKDLESLKKQFGVRAAGTKADLAKKIAERVFAPPKPPKPEKIVKPKKTVKTPKADKARPITADSVLTTFGEMLRGKHARTGLVPIHELRKALAAQHGAEHTGHETLDALLMRLDHEDKIRLVAIGDRSRATPEQLADSIPGENETFFYVETVQH